MVFNKWWSNRNKLKAVHDNDLSDFLSSIGVLVDIENGYIKCFRCGSLITIDNIGLILPYNNDIIIICDNILCLMDCNIEEKD
jgi:hypothetical protein